MIKFKRLIPLIIFLTLLIGFIIFYYNDPSFREVISEEGLKKYILSFGMWGPVVVIIICILSSISMVIPDFLVVFTTTALYGWVNSAIIVWIGYTIGSGLCFLIARFLGRKYVESLRQRKSVQKLDNFLGDEGFKSILLARLIPFIPFNIVSYLAGVTAINFSSFMLGTAIGQIPGTMLYAGLGEFFTKDLKFAVMGVTIFIALIIIISMLRKKFLK